MTDVETGNDPQTQQTLQTEGQTTPAQQPDSIPIPRSEYDQYVSARKNQDQWVERLKKHGLEDIDDNYLNVIGEMHKRQGKVKPEDILGALTSFDEAEEQQSNQALNLTPKQLREMIEKETEERFNKRWEERSQKETIQNQYRNAVSEDDRMIAEIRKELGIPDKIEEDDLYNGFLDDWLTGMKVRMMQQTGFFDEEGHPLSGRAKPLGREAIAKMKERLEKSREFISAREQMEMAKRARKPDKPAPKREPNDETNNFNAEDAEEKAREQTLKAINSSRKARGRQPISQSA